MPSEARPAVRLLVTGSLCLVMSYIALLPWWRNHARLRDFYDYGLFINVNARLAEGQRPFTDFTTPAQTATFLLNYVSERIGGNTYIGMTWGAAGLIVAGVVGMSLILARRWPTPLAILVAGAIVVTSASHHTIVFYNPVGVLALALVVWSFAMAPLLRREDSSWHTLAALGLFLGGLNKINFHLIACAMAVGWILLAGIERKAGIRSVAGSLLFVVSFGLVFPVATEIAWTGAGWELWFHNVVQMPLQARGGRISQLGTPRLYVTTLHGYYGQIRLPQTGLLMLLMPVVAAMVVWRTQAIAPSVWRRVFAILAAGFAAVASTALLLTNNEISYLTLSASVVIAVSLWLGFRLPANGWWFTVGVLLPALLLGVLGWESAWLGQRSQFGHSQEPAASYVSGERIGSDFGYMKGAFIPPNIAHALAEVARWRAKLPTEERAQVFYGPGCEWLEHIWPVHKVRGMSLIPSAFDGPRENALFWNEVLGGANYRHLLVPEAWDNWDTKTNQELSRRFLKEKIGISFCLYRKLPEGVLWARPLEFIPGIGGNVDSTLLISMMPLNQLADGRHFLGITSSTGEMELATPSNRTIGEAVLKRTAAERKMNVPVHFEVRAKAGEARYPRWQANVLLPEDKDELVLPTELIDASGLPLIFTVTIPESLAGQVVAGWRGPRMQDVVDHSSEPPLLQTGAWPVGPAGKNLSKAALPKTLQDAPVFTRNASLLDEQCRLLPGGELWVHLHGLYSKITITAKPANAPPLPVEARVRVIFYKGGRLESFHPAMDPQTGTIHFTAWSPENDGWLGILVAPDRTAPPISVKIESAQQP